MRAPTFLYETAIYQSGVSPSLSRAFTSPLVQQQLHHLRFSRSKSNMQRSVAKIRADVPGVDRCSILPADRSRPLLLHALRVEAINRSSGQDAADSGGVLVCCRLSLQQRYSLFNTTPSSEWRSWYICLDKVSSTDGSCSELPGGGGGACTPIRARTHPRVHTASKTS